MSLKCTHTACGEKVNYTLEFVSAIIVILKSELDFASISVLSATQFLYHIYASLHMP